MWSNETDGLLTVEPVVRWYFSTIFGREEGPGRTPFYCDPGRVGTFAVAPGDLAGGGDASVFRLFVTLAMYQARRDTVIMQQQRSLSRKAMLVLADAAFVKRSIAQHECPTLLSVTSFDQGCTVGKIGDIAECAHRPGASCHVKDATVAFNRMGDMGKLPTSAWLHVWKEGGIRHLLSSVCRAESSPTRRAAILVERFEGVHRVGRKLATMFVSALSTPSLAPGLTPWFPAIDGNELVVIDTNVARAADTLGKPRAGRTYAAREQWVRGQAAQIDLRRFQPELPAYSPRLVQQALYRFCSKSNRVERGDACRAGKTACDACVPSLCPFIAG